MMLYGTVKPFESPVSQTPSHPPQMLNPGDITTGYFMFTAQTHYCQGRKFQGVLQEAFQERALLTDFFMFQHVFLRKATQS